MVMIHSLVEATEEYAVTTFSIGENNPFVRSGVLTESGLIENIAQTAAAHAGHLYKQKGIPVPVGFIAAIKDLEVPALPLVNTTIKTTVTITNKVFDVTIIRGVIEQHGKTLCQCEMKIFTKS